MDKHEDCISRYDIEDVIDEARKCLSKGCYDEDVLPLVLNALEELLKRG